MNVIVGATVPVPEALVSVISPPSISAIALSPVGVTLTPPPEAGVNAADPAFAPSIFNAVNSEPASST